MQGCITRCEPPSILSYTWPEESGHDSEVCVELIARANHVVLVLTHRRLGDHKVLLGVSGGWHTHLGILMDQLRGMAPRPSWTRHERLQFKYAKRFDAR